MGYACWPVTAVWEHFESLGQPMGKRDSQKGGPLESRSFVKDIPFWLNGDRCGRPQKKDACRRPVEDPMWAS